MRKEELFRLFEAVAAGHVSVADAATQASLGAEEADLGFAKVDLGRARRQGVPEVIFGQTKSAAEISGIARVLLSEGHAVLVTRVDPPKAELVAEECPELTYEPIGRLLRTVPVAPRSQVVGPVLVVSAGTSDLPVAREASETLSLFGWPVQEVTDVGVAGLHRLISRLDALRQASVIIVCAGMEGALPSVVGGLVSAPVIAVPTSVGYGVSAGGFAALLGMLGSCASGLTVCNIDNGFGAAIAAIRILQTVERNAESRLGAL